MKRHRTLRQSRLKPPSIFILTVPRRYFCCGSLLFLLSVFILWFSYYVSDIFCKFSVNRMTTYLGKRCSFCLPRVPFVNCRQFMYLVISLFGFEGRIWDLIVSVPDHCLSFYSTLFAYINIFRIRIQMKKYINEINRLVQIIRIE